MLAQKTSTDLGKKSYFESVGTEYIILYQCIVEL